MADTVEGEDIKYVDLQEIWSNSRGITGPGSGTLYTRKIASVDRRLREGAYTGRNVLRGACFVQTIVRHALRNQHSH